MQDRQTGEQVKVHTEGVAGPYIPIGLDQLDRVTRALNRDGIAYSVDRDAVRIDGEPVTAVVNLGQGADVEQVQEVLYAIEEDGEEEQPDRIANLRATATRAIARAAIELTPSLFGLSISLSDIFPKKREEHRKTMEERKTQLVKELTESGIDPVMFDILLSNEMDRRMKVHFGIVFLVLTVLFTVASYAIVVLDAVHQWNISEIAITALIIETPIQFVGLLYVIARNLFPSNEEENSEQRKNKKS